MLETAVDMMSRGLYGFPANCSRYLSQYWFSSMMESSNSDLPSPKSFSTRWVKWRCSFHISQFAEAMPVRSIKIKHE